MSNAPAPTRAEEAREAGQVAYGARFADARPREMTPWADQPDGVKVIWARVERASASFALVQIGDLAKRVGEAEGALHASEKAGILNGWMDRAARAEAEVARLQERVAVLEAALQPFATYAADMPGADFGEGEIGEYYHDGFRRSICTQDIRAARAALEAPHADN